MRYLVCGRCGWNTRVRERHFEEALAHVGWVRIRCDDCLSWNVRDFRWAPDARARWQEMREYRAAEVGEPTWKYDECCFTLIERVMATRIDCPAAAA